MSPPSFATAGRTRVSISSLMVATVAASDLGTSAFHVEIDDAILEATESDVATIICDCGANPGLDQLLDGGDRGGVRLVEEFFAVFDLGAAGGDERRARREVLHDRAQDHRLELLPFAGAFCHGNKIRPEEYPAHTRDAE